jgi:ankyrin repeat protein
VVNVGHQPSELSGGALGEALPVARIRTTGSSDRRRGFCLVSTASGASLQGLASLGRNESAKHGPTAMSLGNQSGLFAFVVLAISWSTGSGLVSAQVTGEENAQEQAQSITETDQLTDDSEVAPPVDLDMSGAPPLIVALYRSTRETKEPDVLNRIAEARALIESGADVQALGPQGRTALHWVAFGSSSTEKPNILTAYEDIAELLIERGVDINKEDIYQDTPLDYADYSPHFELHTLLIENGGVSGYFTGNVEDRFTQLFHDVEVASETGNIGKLRKALAADLRPGQTMDVRLTTPVWSNRSRTGDPVEAIVVAPVVTGSRVVLSPGTRIEGTVFFAQKAPNKYSHPRLVLDFANVIHRNGQRSPIYVRLSGIDNARETVRRNEVIGITQPHASTKISWGMRLAGLANPALGWAIEGVRNAYGLSLRREISLPAGTDLTLQVNGPSQLRVVDSWHGWPTKAVDPEFQRFVEHLPLRTSTPGGTPSDLTNVIFVGTSKRLDEAFTKSGWASTDRTNVASALKVFQATARKSGYEQAPVSMLKLGGAAPDFVFQKSLNTFAKRHHLRIWKQPRTWHGQEIWVGAATHDIGIGVNAPAKWYHRIDPRIDRERAKIRRDLLFADGAKAFTLVNRPRAPRRTRNATGDNLITDGKILVLWLGEPSTQALRSAAP